MKSRRLFIILAIVATILIIPAIAMQFTSEVNWKPLDFVVMGVMLLVVGFSIDFVWRKVTNTKHRVFLLAAIIVLFLIVWAELSVGILGTPFAGS